MDTLLPPPRRLTRRVSLIVGVPFLTGLAVLTLAPSRVEESMPEQVGGVLALLHRLGWTALDVVRLEILANVLLFVPVGVLAFLLLPRRAWALSVLVGPVLSIAIEVVQRVALPGRAPTVDDVVANSVGASIGVALAVFCTLLFAPRSSQHPSPTLEAS